MHQNETFFNLIEKINRVVVSSENKSIEVLHSLDDEFDISF